MCTGPTEGREANGGSAVKPLLFAPIANEAARCACVLSRCQLRSGYPGSLPTCSNAGERASFPAEPSCWMRDLASEKKGEKRAEKMADRLRYVEFTELTLSASERSRAKATRIAARRDAVPMPSPHV